MGRLAARAAREPSIAWWRRVAMDSGPEMSIGQRIAMYRKARGLTQEGLAMRLNRSKSWVT